MKTKITMAAMDKNNPFKIGNWMDYAQIDVTAHNADEGGKDAVTMSFPWAHSLPYMDVKVQDAISKCRETAEKALRDHLEARARKEAKMTKWEKIVRFVRREFSYFWKMGKIGA